MKYLAVILLFFFGWFGRVPFSQHETTMQTSFGGRAQSGKTIEYKIKLIAKAPSTKLSFEGLWVGADQTDMQSFTILKDNKRGKEFLKGDTIQVIGYIRLKPNKEGTLVIANRKSIAVPIEYQGSAVLQYKYKDKIKYYIIDEFKKLPKVYYP
jgi:hypothetical protein